MLRRSTSELVDLLKEVMLCWAKVILKQETASHLKWEMFTRGTASQKLATCRPTTPSQIGQKVKCSSEVRDCNSGSSVRFPHDPLLISVRMLLVLSTHGIMPL